MECHRVHVPPHSDATTVFSQSVDEKIAVCVVDRVNRSVVVYMSHRLSDAMTPFFFSQSVDKEILDILPKIKEAKNIVGLMDRDTLTFDVALQRTEDEVNFLT